MWRMETRSEARRTQSVSTEDRRGENAFPGLREYLVGRFGPEAGEASLEPLNAPAKGVKEGGYGVPYLVRWNGREGVRTLVLETVRPGAFGHEDRADRAGMQLRAFEDYNSLSRHVAAVDVGAFRDTGPAVSLAGLGETFLLTEFAEGSPYAEDFDRIAARGSLEDLDLRRAAALADYLAGIHRDPASHPTWYRRRLRELVGSGECIAGIADSYPVPCGFVDARLLCDVESLALMWRYRLRDRSERLRTIHGDFHPWNILFSKDAEFCVLDRSRGALGGTADDVASLAVNYLFYALRTAGGFAGPFGPTLTRLLGSVCGAVRRRGPRRRDRAALRLPSARPRQPALVSERVGVGPAAALPLYLRCPRDRALRRRPDRGASRPALPVSWTVWLTGPPASGKSEIARALVERLSAEGIAAAWLESDALRQVLEDADYSPAGRDRFYARLADLAALLSEQGVNVIVDATAPRRSYRERLRSRVPGLLEVLVDTPRSVREARDPKGVYRLAREGAAPHVPGATEAYEPPLRPELSVSGTEPPVASAARIRERLRSR